MTTTTTITTTTSPPPYFPQETGISWDELSLPSDDLSLVPVINGEESHRSVLSSVDGRDLAREPGPREPRDTTFTALSDISSFIHNNFPRNLSFDSVDEAIRNVCDLSDADLELEAANLFNCISSEETQRSIAVNSEIASRYERSEINEHNFLAYIDVLLLLADLYVNIRDFKSAYMEKEKALRTQQSISPADSKEQRLFLVEF
jgi:hypothetical protein